MPLGIGDLVGCPGADISGSSLGSSKALFPVPLLFAGVQWLGDQSQTWGKKPDLGGGLGGGRKPLCLALGVIFFYLHIDSFLLLYHPTESFFTKQRVRAVEML